MKSTDNIIYVGVNDKKTDLFESQFPIPNGISYNSYIIDDEKISFEVKQQKNGRLCFTINRRASWLPNKVFRTTFETLREDFAKAYDEFKKERYRVYCQ